MMEKNCLGDYTYEKWLNNNTAFYCGTSKIDNFKIGLVLGVEVCLYLGFFYIGIDFNM